jgi:probable rRNA maturation factor
MSIDGSIQRAHFGSTPGAVETRPSPPRGQRRPRADILVQSPLWNAQPDVQRVLGRALARAAAATATRAGELAIVLTDDAAARDLNRRWRGKDAATNVLSFPLGDGAFSRNCPRLLGDIVIAFETCAREARAQRISFADHLAHLAVHGFLHLIGYDHVTAAEARRMEALEATILRGLGIANPCLSRRAPAKT